MLKCTFSFIIFFLTTTLFAQNASDFPRYTPRMLAYKTLPDEEKVEDVQTNFVLQNWRTGTVTFRNTTDKAVVPLIFDVYGNMLYFLSGNSILEFANPVKEFTIPVIAKKDTIYLHYRSGYPAVDKNGNETFYEILVDGKFQLLRCKAKTIALYKERDIPEEQRDYSKELFYTLLPNGKMVLVKKDKDYLLKEMSEYADRIREIIADQKLKLKDEAQLKSLFITLNR
ncbi:MAG TPA: hypothetical protein VGN63_02725 [Flavisolibacter sp.]|jgi:hypothetical protein|nr:hypothetical protein [Flavisolibacter sp.]